MAHSSSMAEAFAILRLQDAMTPRAGTDLEGVYRTVVAALEKTGARWSVVGAHAVNAYVKRPRATVNIDVVVEASRLDDVIDTLEAERGPLDKDDIGPAVRLTTLSLDLIRSDNHALFAAAIADVVEQNGVRVPRAELLVALKFLSATSPWRRAADRGQDTVDLIRVYQPLGRRLDRAGALQYAASIYPGAERELESLLDRVDRGEKIPI